MGYKIRYDFSRNGAVKTLLNKKPLLLIGTIAVTVVVFVFLFSFNAIDSIRDFLTPGNDRITQAAFSEFADNIRAGDSFKEAITTFCEKIIDDAKLTQ